MPTHDRYSPSAGEVGEEVEMCNRRMREGKVPELLDKRLRVHPKTSQFGEVSQGEGVVERI